MLKKPGNQASTRQASLQKSCSGEACYSDLTALDTGKFLLRSLSSVAGSSLAWGGLKDACTAKVATGGNAGNWLILFQCLVSF